MWWSLFLLCCRGSVEPLTYIHSILRCTARGNDHRPECVENILWIKILYILSVHAYAKLLIYSQKKKNPFLANWRPLSLSLSLSLSVCPPSLSGSGISDTLREYSWHAGAGSPDRLRRCDIWEKRFPEGKIQAQAHVHVLVLIWSFTVWEGLGSEDMYTY